MTATRISRRVDAPRSKVYRALFDPREGDGFRISPTYDAPAGTGKTTAHTDTCHGRFIQLVPDEKVVEVVEFAA